MKTKVLVAMSGGVDSSVAAATLVRAGHEVVGVFMRLGTPDEPETSVLREADEASCDPDARPNRRKGCCSVSDAADARTVAAELGIPLYVCNFRDEFGRIIDYFASEYGAGRTPNPCVRCNDWLKFGRLHDHARTLGCELVASGHYARVDRSGASPRLMRGVDQAKDQSYVLFGVPRSRLSEMLLPIGEFPKARVREMAEGFGLPVFDKPDSQEICFVPDDDYASLVERRGHASGAGEIRDLAGNPVGTHDGHHRYTIGQRRGLGTAFGYPIYVVEKDPAANTITVGPREALRTSSMRVGEANWLDENWERWASAPRNDARRVFVQIRAHAEGVPAAVRPIGQIEAGPSGRTGAFEVRFDSADAGIEGVAPGQAAVLYDADEPGVVIGGGWIRDASRAGAGDG